MEELMTKASHYLMALTSGLIALVISLILCLLVTDPNGHKFDVSTMPVEARQIMDESPGTPITQEQWKRIRKILNQKSWSSGNNLFALDVLASWYWLIVAPAIVLVILRRKWKTLTPVEVLLIVTPSLVTLVTVYFVQ